MQQTFYRTLLASLCIILTAHAFISTSRHSTTFSSPKSFSLLERSSQNGEDVSKKVSTITSQKYQGMFEPKSISVVKGGNKQVWDNAWVPNGERREKVKKLVRGMQKDHLKIFRKHRKSENENSNRKKTDYDEKLFLQEGLDVLDQWAQLGEGLKCESAAEEILSSVQLTKLEDYEFHVEAYRRVLHSYYNYYQRITWHGRYKKPKFTLSAQELRIGQEILQSADATLQQMEKLSRDYVSKSKTTRNPRKTLLGTSDYSPLILGYNHVGKPLPALSALRRLTDLFKQNEHMERVAPSMSLYIAVMKAIFNGDNDEWTSQMGEKNTKADIVDKLCRECVTYARNFPQYVGPASSLLQLYNVALDVWSKVLPPTSKRKQSSIFLDEEQAHQLNQVATKVTELWEMMQEDKVVPNSKTYTSLIYAYTKANGLEEAYLMVERLSELLLNEEREQKLERVDSRALRALANALSWNISSIEEGEDANNAEKKIEIAERVERIIDMLWNLTEFGYVGVTPTVFLYTTAVNAWADAQSTESSLRAQMLVDDLENRYQQNKNDSNLVPDITIYNALLKAIAKQPNLVGAAEKAGEIFKSLEDPSSNVSPDLETYNALIQACLASPKDIEKAEQTLERMILTGDPLPMESTYRSVINALLDVPGSVGKAEMWLDRMEERFLSKSNLYERIVLSWCNEVGKATRARQMLERMEQLFKESGIKSLQPTRSCYNAVIGTLEDQGEPGDTVKNSRDEMYGISVNSNKLTSNKEVFALLDEIDSGSIGGSTPVGNTVNFNQAISLLAESENIWAGSRAEDILNFMLELTFKRKNRNAIPNIVTFNSVIAAWAKSNHALAGERSAGVLKKLEDLHDMNQLEDVQPNRVTYNTLMNVYAKASEREDSVHKAQGCMNKLIDLYEKTRDDKYRPDIISYSTLLSAWARSGQPDAAENAETLLLKMIEDSKMNPKHSPQPNTICFNEVLYSWARSGHPNAISRMRTIFQLMYDMNEAGHTTAVPDTRSFNILLLSFANSLRKDSAQRALVLLDEMEQMSVNFGKPDAISYNTIISAFLKKGDMESGMEILDGLLARDDLKLNNRFFSSLIFSLSETDAVDAPAMADTIVKNLLETPEYIVDTRICNSLINCWGRANVDEGPHRAMDILQGMLNGDYGKALPDVATFTSVIDIWAKSGQENAVTKVEEVMELMKGTAGVSPNTQTYTAFIQAVARSNLSNKARKAQEILQLMKDDYSSGNRDARPSLYSYNAVLNAAEFTFGRDVYLEEAFAVACEVFDEARSTMQPDHVTYATFLGVTAQLMPKSGIRNDMVQLVFRRCCMDGQLAPLTIKKFKQAATEQQFLDLMGNSSEDDLPDAWTCNIRNKML